MDKIITEVINMERKNMALERALEGRHKYTCKARQKF
jgi:hypothetical protein